MYVRERARNFSLFGKLGAHTFISSHTLLAIIPSNFYQFLPNFDMLLQLIFIFSAHPSQIRFTKNHFEYQ